MEITPKVLENIRKAFDQIDKELRQIATCPVCGKPTCGVIKENSNAEESGLCVCKRKEGLKNGNN